MAKQHLLKFKLLFMGINFLWLTAFATVTSAPSTANLSLPITSQELAELSASPATTASMSSLPDSTKVTPSPSVMTPMPASPMPSAGAAQVVTPAPTATASPATIVIPTTPTPPLPAVKPYVKISKTALPTLAGANKHLWNLKNADIINVIEEVSRETGKNFIIDPRVSGKVTLISTTPIGPDELYQMFLSALQVYGYAAVPDGNVIKVVPVGDAKQQPAPVVNTINAAQNAEIIVQVIPLSYVNVEQLLPILQPLLPPWASISAYTPTNVLIISATSADIARILSIIAEVDKAETNDIEIIPLHYATATDMVSTLNNLLNAQRTTGGQAPVSLAADQRSNSILLSGNTQARLHIRVLISELDTPPSRVGEDTEVIYLHYLNAAKFAPIISKIAQSEFKAAQPGGGAAATAAAAASGGPLAPTILAEQNTNSLVITATSEMLKNLHNIINQLDLRPTQVLVEAAIVEVDQSEVKQLGIQWGTVPTDSTNQQSFGGQVDNFTSGVAVIQSGRWQAIISALEDSNQANILSTPSVVVLDNQTATIAEGKQVSTQNGAYATTGTTATATPFTTFERDSFTLSLNVTPQISPGNSVQLSINQNDNSLDNPENPSTTPESNINNIKTRVIVNNGDILVLGGLINNDLEKSEQKIPILGDIPVIGQAFRYNTSSINKKELMVFLHPIILHNPDDGTRVTTGRYNHIRDLQLQWEQDKLSINHKDQLLPAWVVHANLPPPAFH